MPRTYDQLWPIITAFENLWSAWQAAARGKHSSPEVAAFGLDAESRLLELQRTMQAKAWQPGGYRSFIITDPKRRKVSAAPFADRIVHHALVRVLEPIYEPIFIPDSYANRRGRGVHAAVARTQGFSHRYRYVLQCDLRQFFPAVDHAVLRAMLARKISCEPTLELCHRIIASGDGVLADEYTAAYFPGDDLLAAVRPRGLPIGNLTSQFWANVLLNDLDQFVKRQLRCRAYLRYVDDFLLFSDDKRVLWSWKDQIRDRLTALRLSLHERESTVYPCETGIPFLGKRIFPTHVRLKSRNARAFEVRFRNMQIAYASGDITLDDITRRVRGWVAHAEHADTVGLRRTLFAKPWSPKA